MEKKKPENRFFAPSKQPTDSAKASRILYIVIISVLCISAILVGIVSALNRSQVDPTPSPSPDQSDNASSDEGKEPEDTKPSDTSPDTVPAMVAPAVGSLSQSHSPDDFVYSTTMNDWRTHDGIDIAAQSGSQVYAVADGVISRVYEDPLMGSCVTVSMNGKAVAIYQNLGTLAEGIQENVSVKQGDVIASVGESSLIECAEEPHLHFSLTVDGKSVDPMAYFTKDAIAASLTVDVGYED